MLTHIVTAGMLFSPVQSQVGTASWYGKENRTSCTGKRLSHSKLEAAHKTIPLGTKVKVTSLSSRKSVVVTIADRGPYTKGRILDLNVKAATSIGIKNKGIDRVKLEWKKNK
jgi:rare lipoprotein A